MADQISDAILDAMLKGDPQSRVAVETMITTGQVHVAGEVTTTTYVDIPELIRDKILEIGYDSSAKGYDGASCGVSLSIGSQSPDIAQGVTHAFEHREGEGEDDLDRQGAGDQGLMFGYACRETPELMPLPIMLAHRLSRRLAEVRHSGEIPYIRPDGKTQVTIEYAGNEPVRLDTIVISTQHAPAIDLKALLMPDVRERVVEPVLASLELDKANYRLLVNPTGRFGPHREQDHHRHVWRHGTAWWRCLLRQGSVQGRQERGLCHALGGQERRRGGSRGPVRDSSRLCHRQGEARRAVRRVLRHRASPARADPGSRPHGVRPEAGGDHQGSRATAADLRADRHLRALRSRRARFRVGAYRQGGRAAGGRRAVTVVPGQRDAGLAGRARPRARPAPRRRAGLGAKQVAAAELPVARVAVDMPLPHLDRLFDYLVPEALASAAVPGCRVRVRFSGRLTGGFLVERAGATEHDGRLAFLERVLSPEPVLTREIAVLARAVADRYGGTLADVLRLAIPPRHAAAEAALPSGTDDSARVAPADSDSPGSWSRYRTGPAFLEALRGGRVPHAVWSALPGPAWPAEIALAVAATVAGGRGAVVIVPDAKDLDLVDSALTAVLGVGAHVSLSAQLGPAERYRRWLTALRRQVSVVAGTRSAAFAPVHRLGLVVIWDDGDDLHAEPRAPYPHARDVLVMRAHRTGAAALIGGLDRKSTRLNSSHVEISYA